MPSFYRVVQVAGNGDESVLQDFPYTDGSLPEEQAQRAEASAFARTKQDEGLHVRIYSTDESGEIKPGDDLIADSAVNV